MSKPLLHYFGRNARFAAQCLPMTYQFYCQKLQQTLTYCSTVQKGKLYFADEVNFAELAGGVIFLLTHSTKKIFETTA